MVTIPLVLQVRAMFRMTFCCAVPSSWAFCKVNVANQAENPSLTRLRIGLLRTAGQRSGASICGSAWTP